MPRFLLRAAGERIAVSVAQRGYAVCDLAIPAISLAGLRDEVLSLHETTEEGQEPFFSATGQVAHRSDLTGWIGTSEAIDRGLIHMPGIIKMLLEEIPEALHNYQIENTNQHQQNRQLSNSSAADTLTRILPPDRAMLSLYQDGALYKPHRDSIRQDDMGLFGFPMSVGREYLKNGSNAALVHMATLNSDVAQVCYFPALMHLFI